MRIREFAVIAAVSLSVIAGCEQGQERSTDKTSFQSEKRPKEIAVSRPADHDAQITYEDVLMPEGQDDSEVAAPRPEQVIASSQPAIGVDTGLSDTDTLADIRRELAALASQAEQMHRALLQARFSSQVQNAQQAATAQIPATQPR